MKTFTIIISEKGYGPTQVHIQADRISRSTHCIEALNQKSEVIASFETSKTAGFYLKAAGEMEQAEG